MTGCTLPPRAASDQWMIAECLISGNEEHGEGKTTAPGISVDDPHPSQAALPPAVVATAAGSHRYR